MFLMMMVGPTRPFACFATVWLCSVCASVKENEKEEIKYTVSYASIYRDQCEKKRDEHSEDFHDFLISFGYVLLVL